MGTDEVTLEIADVIGGDAVPGEGAEASIYAVNGIVAGSEIVDGYSIFGYSLVGGGSERDGAMVAGDIFDGGEGEWFTSENQGSLTHRLHFTAFPDKFRRGGLIRGGNCILADLEATVVAWKDRDGCTKSPALPSAPLQAVAPEKLEHAVPLI